MRLTAWKRAFNNFSLVIDTGQLRKVMMFIVLYYGMEYTFIVNNFLIFSYSQDDVYYKNYVLKSFYLIVRQIENIFYLFRGLDILKALNHPNQIHLKEYGMVFFVPFWASVYLEIGLDTIEKSYSVCMSLFKPL